MIVEIPAAELIEQIKINIESELNKQLPAGKSAKILSVEWLETGVKIHIEETKCKRK